VTKTLLLVDDDPFVRGALTRALNRAGAFTVVPAEHGRHALELLDTEHVDVMLTDLQMPVMDGLTLLSHLVERGLRLPVAVMTGHSIAPTLRQRLQAYGIAATFTKPVDVSVLADELQRALDPETVGRIRGITLFGLLQLLEVEEKTGLVVVQAGGQEGRMYFENGALVHAHTRGLEGVDAAYEILTWPESGQPVLRFTFSRFKEIGGMGKERTYLTDTTAENLSDKMIGGANFSLYVFDKNKARIGEGYITLSNVSGGQTVKFQITLAASGNPASLALSTSTPRTVSTTVNSVPQGALLRVDGKEVGTTPKIVEVSIGKHVLEFSKEGFNSGKFPLEITSRDASGGSVSYELGSAAHDTVELRDGSVLSGDLVSVSGMQVVVRIGGNAQTFDRNQIKRILLTERDPAN